MKDNKEAYYIMETFDFEDDSFVVVANKEQDSDQVVPMFFKEKIKDNKELSLTPILEEKNIEILLKYMKERNL